MRCAHIGMRMQLSMTDHPEAPTEDITRARIQRDREYEYSCSGFWLPEYDEEEEE